MKLIRCFLLIFMALFIFVNMSNSGMALEAFEITAFDIVMDVQRIIVTK